jgi:hypothetical protein
MLGILALCTPLLAQQARWEMRQATIAGYNKFHPQAAIDRWGNTHMLWASLDPHRGGIQLFYTTDASGRFSSPIQATDSGTVYDTLSAALAPWLLKLDADGFAHIGFLANTDNHIRLCYTTNRLDGRAFAPARAIAEIAQYGMAVDSLGTAHMVWVEVKSGVASFNYWNSGSPGSSRTIGTLVCSGPSGRLWRIGSPEVAIGPEGLVVAVRSDSGAVYMMRGAPSGEFSTMEKIVAPGYDAVIGSTGVADLRLRLAIDGTGIAHLILPADGVGGDTRLYHLEDQGGAFGCTPLTAPLGGAVKSFSLALAGERMVVAWNVSRTGFAELAPGKGGWSPLTVIPDILGVLGSSGTQLLPDDISIAAGRDRLAIAGLVSAFTDSARQQVGLVERLDLSPRIRYLLPDAAAPGMNVVMEAYAAPRDRGSFGPDGFHGADVSFELVRPGDSSRLVIGPSVVSWDGRLVSTMIFVKGGATPGAVPLRLRVGGIAGGIDTFFVVEPQHIGGSAGRLDGGGALGSGGVYGVRSRRGVLVVDSLVLAGGVYTIDTLDTDPGTPGNQGFLPVTILSRGPVRIGADAVLSVAGRNDLARGIYGIGGPGGGGGGTGGEQGTGSGYTGGGGIARLGGTWMMGASTGSGGDRSGLWNGGPSLNGAPGGETFTDAPGGGGTGHPFGTSGLFAKSLGNYPFLPNVGGDGGGTAGATSSHIASATAGGGGGGHATPGGNGGVGIEDNHGLAVGTRELVPISGGSGGGGGGYGVSGYASGGGGGGALALFSFGGITIDGSIDADGAKGIDAPGSANGSGGGGGAGGGILLGAQGTIVFGPSGRIHADGGAGGKGYVGTMMAGRDGGSGGTGRIRVDGRMIGGAAARYSPAPGYMGPGASLPSAVPMRNGAVVSGSGAPGSHVRVFVRTEGSAWNYGSYRDLAVGSDSTWSFTLGSEADAGQLYIVAMQQVAKPMAGGFTYEPAWVMSTAGGSGLGRPSVSFDVNGVAFPCIRFNTCDSARLTVRNTGQAGDLGISSLKVTGRGASAFRVPAAGMRVAAGSSRDLEVYFCPPDTGSYEADLEIGTNIYPDTLRVVHLSGCATTGILTAREKGLDLGDLCPGDCRDTVIHLHNDGRADLTVAGVMADPSGLAVGGIAPALPFTIAPGAGVDLHLSLCPKRFDAAVPLTITSNMRGPVLALMVGATNIGPSPELPTLLDFGAVEEGKDSCVTRTLVIGNRNGSRPLRLKYFTLASDQFTLVDPSPAGMEIPAGGSIAIRLRFCAKAVMDYSAIARIVFDGGHCSLDTAVKLNGSVISHRPRVTLKSPADRTLRTKPMLIGQPSPAETIVLFNSGTAPATIAVPVVSSGAAEVSIVPSERLARVIAPNDSLLIHVTMTPKALGARTGTIVLMTDDNSWSEAITVTGEGLKPGIMVDADRVDFGNVRVVRNPRDPLPQKEVMIFNTGTAPVRVDDVVLAGDGEFTRTFVSAAFPATLYPASPGHVSDTLRVFFLFTPQAEGARQASIRVVNTSDREPVVTLMAAGAMEHLTVDKSAIDFGCLLPGELRDTTITYTNTGPLPLQLKDIAVAGDDASYTIVKGAGGDVLKAGESRTDTVRFTARGVAPGNASLVVEGSAPESYEVPIDGRICSTDERTVRLRIADRTARVGAYINIPVLVHLPRPVSAPLPYSFRLSYAYDLLAPLTTSREDARPVVLDGSISGDARMVESQLGELTVSGTILPGRSSDTLLSLPFKVLLGSTYRTEVAFVDAALIMPSMRLELLPGLFEAVDCDTTGTLIVLGAYSLGQNAPNPFNRITVIPYSIAHNERVILTLYNDKGDVVRSLLNEVQPAGRHEYRIDDPTLPSGIYTYELVAGPYRKSRRMVVIE